MIELTIAVFLLWSAIGILTCEKLMRRFGGGWLSAFFAGPIVWGYVLFKLFKK